MGDFLIAKLVIGELGIGNRWLAKPNHVSRFPNNESLTLEHFLGDRVELKGLFRQLGGAPALRALGIVVRVGILFQDFNRIGNLFFVERKGHGTE